jgi:uncharacterized protein
MKFLLLFFIFMVLLWQWRHAREKKVRQAKPQDRAGASVVNMVPCAHCGMHLPDKEAVKGNLGMYCTEAHRQAREP